MRGKTCGINGGRGDQQLEVITARPLEQTFEITEQKVDIEAAFVRFIDDDRVVLPQQRIGLGFGKQDAVGHQLDLRAARNLLVEADLVADILAKWRAEFFSDSPRDTGGRQAARLGVTDQAAHAASSRDAQLGKLGGFARAGLTADDDHRMRRDRRGDFVAPGRNRQGFRKQQLHRQIIMLR